MSKLTALFGANGATVVVAGAVVVAAAGAGVYFSTRSAETVETPAPVVEAAVVPEAAPDPAPAAIPEVETRGDVAVVAAPPSIDEVRLEPDGLTIVAGRAAPGSEVSVLLDGAENTSVTTDPGGSFAAITILPPSAKAQILTVVQRVGADEIASDDEVILAPQARPAPVAVADATEETAPEVATEEVAASDPVVEPTVDVPVAPEVAAVEATDVAPTPTEVAPVEEPAPVLAEVETAAPAQDTAPATDGDTIAALPATTVAEAPVTPEVAAPVTDAPADTTAEAEQDTAPVVAATQAPASEPATAAPAPAETVAALDTQDDIEAPAPATAPAAVTVLRSTAEGVEVLSNARPEALDNIEIDTISYSETGDVQLAGRAQSEADVVRVYVNNKPIADLDVSPAGDWRGDLPEIDTGVYTLRVDELNKEGEVTSRIETPFRREDPEVLAAIDDPSSPAAQITVQTGNTLWGIARDRYGEGRLFVEVFEANRERIRNPDLIFPGQVFALPN
ncbi:LysM peptidoglycan-binding domain-containing protein [uncultured Tateyamaria sp.]|uniref:LysM peptidoglycan-binding domain-containing protein n=1 Tax=uncultured Tateyamaria sp. TaxID=455651 RepID=UPI0026185C78|nr:LysM peptidoglycan-binding domain-containing protein [uncultured Tateyamaria sp.]